MVVHTTKAVPVEYVERIESEEKSNAVADQIESLGSLQVLLLVVEVAHIAKRLIEQFDREPDVKARIAQALWGDDHEREA